jgi:DNA-binding ferritin-like protein (Dps family)
MREIETKFDALSQKIEKMQKQALSGTKTTMIGYIVVVVFVFAYTSFLMWWIKKEVTADNLSAQMKIMIEGSVLTDANREKMVSYCRDQAPVWADGLVQMTHDQLIPMMKLKVKSIIDNTTDSGITILKRDLFPEIKKLIESNAAELNQHKDIADPDIANEIAKILTDESEREMNKFINDKVKSRINHLRNQFDKMSAIPYNKLTRKEAAERRLIVNWVYLMEHDEAPSDIFGEFMRSVNGTYEGIMKSLTLSH